MPLVLPGGDACFTVFSQRADARADVAEWARHAERFLGTLLHRTGGSESAGDGDPRVRVVLGPLKEAPGTSTSFGERSCWSRPRTDEDVRAAKSAAGGAGLDALAERCPQVWLVATNGVADDDATALRLAAILAGVLLGPILSPGGRNLFGPKTARQRLAL